MSLSERLHNSPGTDFSMCYEPFKYKKNALRSDRKGRTYLQALKNGGNMQQRRQKIFVVLRTFSVFI